jgi:hypothetical protein
VTNTDRKIVDHMLALQAELDTERVRRFAETQRADRERTLRIAAERAVRDTFLAINHKAVKTAESRTVERLATMLREQMEDLRFRDIVEVVEDYAAVAEASGAVHHQDMGAPYPGTRDEVVAAIAELRGRAELVEVLEEDVERLRADRDAVLAERDGERARVRHLTQRLEAVEREHALEGIRLNPRS